MVSSKSCVVNSFLVVYSDIYNALTIHGLVEREKLPSSVIDVQLYWKTTAYKICSQLYNLYDMEHGILRGNVFDPVEGGGGSLKQEICINNVFR